MLYRALYLDYDWARPYPEQFAENLKRFEKRREEWQNGTLAAGKTGKL